MLVSANSESDNLFITSVLDVMSSFSGWYWNSTQESEKELCIKNFYRGAAEYIGCELVSAAIEGGSRDSITVMVMFLNGSEYHRRT